MAENSTSSAGKNEEVLITQAHLKALQKELKNYSPNCIDDLVKEFQAGIDKGELTYNKVVNKANVFNILNGQVRNQLAMLCLYKAGTTLLERYRENARKIFENLKVSLTIPEMSEEDKAAYDALPKKKTRYKKATKVLVKL